MRIETRSGRGQNRKRKKRIREMTLDERRQYETKRKRKAREKQKKADRVAANVHKYLHSCQVNWFGPDQKTHNARYMAIYRLSRQIIQDTVHNHLESILKMPLNNSATSNLFAPSALDFYFGRNLETISDMIILRYAYGVFAGNNTIAMDPCRLKVRGMTAKMETLAEVCHQITKFHFNQPGVDPRKLVKCHPYTGCVFKGYNQTQTTVVHSGKNKGKLCRKKKKVKTHTDQEFNKKSNDCEAHEYVVENNSQIEMTPVCIVTYGDTKKLTFEQWRIKPDGVKELVKNVAPVSFALGSYSIFILDPRDEYKQGPYRVWYQHRAECLDARGVSWSIIFRCLKKSCAVQVIGATGALVVPPSLGPIKDVQMDRARRNLDKDLTFRANVKTEMEHIKRHLLRRHGKFVTENNRAVFDQFEIFNETNNNDLDDRMRQSTAASMMSSNP